MTASNTPKINVRNSVIECAQSLKKENVGKYHNYGIKDCITSLAATKQKQYQVIVFKGLNFPIGVVLTSEVAVNRSSQDQ